jgi:hypothetical protein
MTAEELIAFNGLLALEASARAEAADDRDKTVIVDELLREIGAPDIAISLYRLRRHGRSHQ